MIIIEELHPWHITNPRVLWALVISDLRDRDAAKAELEEFAIKMGRRPPLLIGLKPDIWPNYQGIGGQTEYNLAVSLGAKVIESLRGRVKGCYE